MNLRGEVVGINTAIFSTTGGYQGIGFAVPINNAKRIISQLIAGKRIPRGWLGVVVQGLNDQLVQYLGLQDVRGVLVIQVVPGGPADIGGLRPGDVIEQLDNIAVDTTRKFLNAIAQLEAGRSIKIVVLRDKQQLSLAMTVGLSPDEGTPMKPQESQVAVEGKWRGMTVAETNEGVFVVKVIPGSPADVAGIVGGDIMLEINKRPVVNLADYKNVISGLKGNCLIRTGRGYFLLKD
ncbi:MAG: PDZ domain-containing protein [Candidatus Omnitrophica bacterium]|nr:PDZ domain-containing protein [Candidatus Omnitrophota bacterium]